VILIRAATVALCLWSVVWMAGWVGDVQDAQAENSEERGLGAFVYLEGPQEGNLWFLLAFGDTEGVVNILG
jgi:hypothetical protein